MIQSTGVTTKAGNTLEFFYNPDNDLVVIDLISKKETGGKELLRVTLNEKAMLKHCPNEMPYRRCDAWLY